MKRKTKVGECAHKGHDWSNEHGETRGSGPHGWYVTYHTYYYRNCNRCGTIQRETAAGIAAIATAEAVDRRAG